MSKEFYINKSIESFAEKCYNNANCKYGENNGSYMLHVNMVVDVVLKHKYVFISCTDIHATVSAAFLHDTIEDAKQSCNDITAVAGKDVADIVLCVTDTPANNRLMKHLLTMHRTVSDYRAIILKMCDMHANASYSKEHGSSMYRKYVIEYAYRRPIFQIALGWYKNQLNQMELDLFWKELDEIHNFNIK